jgi:hypothetical protein
VRASEWVSENERNKRRGISEGMPRRVGRSSRPSVWHIRRGLEVGGGEAREVLRSGAPMHFCAK